ncbi:MAG: cytochrome b N-terminal domain-containing protein [Dehalococcoidia bacterium]
MRLLWAVWLWFDDRSGISKLVGPVLRHPVPAETAGLKSGWMYLFGVGTLTAFIVQVVTGIALATLYSPATASAYDSLKFITDKATLGSVLRGMHFFGASAMVLFVGLHMMRTYLTGSFKFPRELNWLSGVVLLMLTLAMAFTGQLLRWDDNGVWSLVVAIEQVGRLPVLGQAIGRFLLAGKTVGATTLSRFFAYHVFFIPALIFAILGFHLYLVLHNGISEPPKVGEPVDPKTYRAQYRHLVERHGTPYFPDAAWHEIGFAVLLIVGITLLAIFIGPPKLSNPPDPASINAFPRPDWYFLWYFALLALLRPSFENYVIILGPLVVFTAFFLVPFIANKGERHPIRRPWAPAIAVRVVIMIGALWRYGVVAPWTPHFDAKPLSAQQVGAASGPVFDGSQLFYTKGCEFCHAIDGQGGIRGPDLTHIADRLPVIDITTVIAGGRGNMPAYVNNMAPQDMEEIIAFLESRKQAGQ